MKTKVTILGVILFALFAATSSWAEPQDNWYIAKEFRGDLEGGKFNNPHDAHLGPDGNIYVADRYNHQVQVFDGDGNFLRKWGGYGTAFGKFNETTGIHVSPQGKVYVSELQNHRVQVFDLQGTFLLSMGQTGNGDGQLNYAHGVTVDDGGNVYVVDHGLSRVMVFNPDGSYLRQWGSPGSADGQFSAAIAIGRTPDNRIAVLERDGGRVQVFNTNGTFSFKFAEPGGGDGQLCAPHGIDTDSAGNFYIPQHGCGMRVSVFSSTGTFLRRFGSDGAGDRQFSSPYGLAIGNGKAWVCDYGNNRICVFTTLGEWVKNFGSRGVREFNQTYGVCVDTNENIYITDYHNQQVRKFDKNLTPIRRFGSAGNTNGQFNGPIGIAVGPNNKVYVVDHPNHRVQIFDENGSFLGKFGSNGSAQGCFLYPYGVTVSSSGRVYVTDGDNHRVQIFDLDGNFISYFGRQGSFNGEFQGPHGITISQDGSVMVADAGNERIQVFSPSGAFLKKLVWPRWAYYWGATPVQVYYDKNECLLYAAGYHGNQSDGISVYSKDGAVVSQFATSGWAAMAQTLSGDLLAAHVDNVLRVWKRAYRGQELWRARSTNALPLPSVISTAQRPGTTYVDVDFKVQDADDATVQTAACAWIDGRSDLGGFVPMRTFVEGTSNVLGNATPSGTNLHLVWNVPADWAGGFANSQIEILAKDGRGLMDIQYLTIPAYTNLPALVISKTGLTDADALTMWVWLVARGSADLQLTNGVVTGKTGLYVDKVLASGAATTGDGWNYLLGLLNARMATGEETARASAGQYGFLGGGVTIVKLP